MQTAIDFDRLPTNGTATSNAAAKSMRKAAPKMRAQVLAYIKAQGFGGATCCEIERMLSMTHQSASARVYDLHKAHIICDSGRTRPTKSGRQATVWWTCR